MEDLNGLTKPQLKKRMDDITEEILQPEHILDDKKWRELATVFIEVMNRYLND